MQATFVRVRGGRKVRVERAPLPRVWGRGYEPLTLVRRGPGLLVVRPHLAVVAVAWFFRLLGWPVLALMPLAAFDAVTHQSPGGMVGVGLLLLWGVVFSAVGVVLPGPRFRLDADAGVLSVRHCLRTRRRPLADVAAVQVVYAGAFWVKNGRSDRRRCPSWQLNLALGDGEDRRLLVACNPDHQDVLAKARQIAEFLKVPLVVGTDGP